MGCLKGKMRYNPSGVVSAEKHSRLTKLLANKTIWIHNGEYMGKAADGIVVNMGTVCFEESLENYLIQCPGPKNW